MATGPRAIVLVPGLADAERQQQLHELVTGLEQGGELATASAHGSSTVEGLEGVRLAVARPGEPDTTVDVFEAFWGDLFRRLSREELTTRVRRGATLLFFWLFSGIWRGLRGRVFLTLSLVSSALLVLLWYYGTVALVLTAIGETPELLAGGAVAAGGVAAPAEEASPEVTAQIATTLGAWGRSLGGWAPWVVITLVLSFLPVNVVVDIADFTRRYLNDAPVGVGPVGTRTKVRNRVRHAVDHVTASGRYERVTVVAHSFGTAVAVDVLSHYSPPAGVELHLVTLAGPLELLARRAPWVADEVAACVDNQSLASWTDFSSRVDWMCSRAPFPDQGPRLRHFEADQVAGLADRLAGRPHQRYFALQRVVHLLLGAG